MGPSGHAGVRTRNALQHLQRPRELGARFGDLPAETRARLIGKISLRPDWRLTPQGVLAIPAPVAGMERIRRAESALKDLL